MSGSSGMSSVSRWSCVLTISISESVRDMVAMSLWVAQESREPRVCRGGSGK
jgi:hypothetical protein